MTGIDNIAAIAQRICGAKLSSLAERDERADEGKREIHCTPERLIMRRRIAGIDMKVETQAKSYSGIALTAVINGAGKPVYRLSMLHADPGLTVILYEALDDRDVIAVWKSWANYFALPRLVERRPGEVESCEIHLGTTILGDQPLWRRRGSALDSRKPTHRCRRRNAHAILKAHGSETAASAIAES